MSRTYASVNEAWRELRKSDSHSEGDESSHGSHRHRGYDPNQPRVPRGQSDGGQWTSTWPSEIRRVLADPEGVLASLASDEVLSDAPPEPPRVWSQYAQAGTGQNSRNAAVKRTENLLTEVLVKVNFQVARATRGNPVSARLYGVLVHALFAREVRELDLPGIGREGVEQSFDVRGLARYGLDGSIRTDVVLRNRAGDIIAIFDVKTGNATLGPVRESRIREFTRVGPDVPIIILRAQRGAGLW